LTLEGSALAWPLIDAAVDSEGKLCALHRGDSFMRPDSTATDTRTARYSWNGFGFSGVAEGAERCSTVTHGLIRSLR
jgi:poly-gamma-glutamate synthesis protein (capsule biosynthesis protein)